MFIDLLGQQITSTEIVFSLFHRDHNSVMIFCMVLLCTTNFMCFADTKHQKKSKYTKSFRRIQTKFDKIKYIVLHLREKTYFLGAQFNMDMTYT